LKIEIFGVILNFAALNYQEICIKKIFLTKPLDGVSVEFMFGKNQPNTNLVFGRHFDFFSNHLFFSKNLNIFA
jgi:hypothetical protein